MRGRHPVSKAALTATIGVLLALVAPHAHAAEVPEPPFPDAEAVPQAQSGPVEVEKSGSVALASVGDDHTSVFAYVYTADDQPQAVGWQELEEGTFKIDLLLLPAGDHAIVVLDEDGETVGWDTMATTADESTAQPLETTEETGGIGPLTWIALAGLLVAGAGWAGLLYRRRRDRTVADGTTEKERETT